MVTPPVHKRRYLTVKPMPVMKPTPRRRNITYKKRVAPIITEMEDKLCDEYGLNISEVHVLGIKTLFNQRQDRQLPLFVSWLWFDVPPSKS